MNTVTATHTETRIEALRHDCAAWFARNDEPTLRAILDIELNALPVEHETLIDRNGDIRVMHYIPDDVQIAFFTKWHARLNKIAPMEDMHSHE